MKLWQVWWTQVVLLKPAFNRTTTFLWFASILAGFIVRGDLMGVTSVVRALGLQKGYYERLLAFFHSQAVSLDTLTHLWTWLVLKHFPGICRFGGRIVLVADGLKYPKSGQKMPAVKKLYQSSQDNTKPRFILGHSFQVVGLLCQIKKTLFCVPLIARIHEGLVFTNRDPKTLLDKLVLMINSLSLQKLSYYFTLVVDNYFASGKVIKPLLAQGNHLVTRVRSNAVAYSPPKPNPTRKAGRPRRYGTKRKLGKLWIPKAMSTMASPVYGEADVTLSYRCLDLLWRPAGTLVRFVWVDHPLRGRLILMCTDLNLSAQQIIQLYGYRFKIEVSFKQAIYTLGTYRYHFWMADMHSAKRRGANQYLHRETESYRRKVKRKRRAYHIYVQVCIIAQGLLQYLSLCHADDIWKFFGSWIRTIRPDQCPSEQVVAVAMRNTFPEFLKDTSEDTTLQKFLLERIDLHRSEGLRLAA
jgi:hypothetical protein